MPKRLFAICVLAAVAIALVASSRIFRGSPPANEISDASDVHSVADGAAVPEQELGVVLKGVVKDENGLVAATVTVAAEGADSSRTVDAPSGAFSLRVEPGTYVFSARSREGKVAWRQLIVSGSDATIELTLQGGVKLEGVVLDPDGVPLAGAAIYGETANLTAVVLESDATGRFAVTLPNGEYAVFARHRGATSARQDVFLDHPQSIELRVRRTAELRGRVVVRGEPASDADVAAIAESGVETSRTWRAKTDAKGEFVITGLNPAEYTIRARHGSTVASAAHVTAIPDLPPFVELHGVVGGTISGRVVRTGVTRFAPEKPVVTTQDDSRSAFGQVRTSASEDGSFRLEGLFPGRVLVSAGWHAELGSKSATLFPGQSLQAIIDLDATQSDVEVECRDSSGMPVEAAKVSAGPREACLTDRLGRCRLQLPESAQTEIAGSSVKYGFGKAVVKVAAGRTTRIVVTLEPWASVGGRVEWENGSPSVGVYVRASRRVTRTDSSGSFTLEGLEPGDLVVSAIDGTPSAGSVLIAETTAVPTSSAVVRPSPGERASVKLVLKRKTARVFGSVVDTTGIPVAYARVGLVPQITPEHDAADDLIRRQVGDSDAVFTNGDGTFEFKALPSVRYAVWAVLPPFPLTVRYDVRGQDTPLRISIPAGSDIDVRVVRGHGETVSSFLASLSPEGGERHGVGDFRQGRDGRFSFSHVAPGRYEVAVRGEDTVGSSTVIIGSEKRRYEVEVALARTASVTGRLVSRTTREAVSNAIVEDANEPTVFTLSKSDGRFELRDLSPKPKATLSVHCLTQCKGLDRALELPAGGRVELGDVEVP